MHVYVYVIYRDLVEVDTVLKSHLLCGITGERRVGNRKHYVKIIHDIDITVQPARAWTRGRHQSQRMSSEVMCEELALGIVVFKESLQSGGKKDRNDMTFRNHDRFFCDCFTDESDTFASC